VVWLGYVGIGNGYIDVSRLVGRLQGTQELVSGNAGWGVWELMCCFFVHIFV
jgi:hypothetical protein